MNLLTLDLSAKFCKATARIVSENMVDIFSPDPNKMLDLKEVIRRLEKSRFPIEL
jgi:hypothetical protein